MQLHFNLPLKDISYRTLVDLLVKTPGVVLLTVWLLITAFC